MKTRLLHGPHHHRYMNSHTEAEAYDLHNKLEKTRLGIVK